MRVSRVLGKALPLSLAIAVLLGAPLTGLAQALPFHTSTGITAGFNENAARHFVRFVGRSGLMRDGVSVTDPMSRDVDGLAVINGAILGGFTPLWTFRVIVPWVHKEMEFRPEPGRAATFETSGVGDVLLQTKWIFYRNDRPAATTRLGVQGRVTLPVGGTDARLPSGQVAPRSLQVGTGTWAFEPKLILTNMDGRWGLHGNLGGRFSSRDEGFEPGDALLYDLAVGFRFVPWIYESLRDQSVVVYLELNGELASRDALAGQETPDSGGHLVWIGPALQWIPAPWLLFEGSMQVPVVQDLNGTQLGHDARIQFGTRYRFSLFRE